FLRRICDHGEQLLPPEALKAWLKRDTTAADWSLMQGYRRHCNICNVEITDSEQPDLPWSERSCLHAICSDCAIARVDENALSNEGGCPVCNKESAIPISQKFSMPITEGDVARYQPSTKVRTLLENLHKEQYHNRSSLAGNPIKR